MVIAVVNRDYPMIQASIFFFAIAVVVLNLVTDIAYALVDPRLR